MDKEGVRQYWENRPNGADGIPYPEGTREYFDAIEENRYRVEPFLLDLIKWDAWKGKKVLDIGCGVGSDMARFARAGADIIGVDLTARAISLTNKRLQIYNLSGKAIEGDAERLPFGDNEFDLTFSNGVIHHTPDTEKAISEIYRVTKEDGQICIMVYNRHSLVALQTYIWFGLLRGKPLRSVRRILANHHESLGTKAYTISEVKQMFSMFTDLDIRAVVTLHDIRYGRGKFLPRWVGPLVPNRFGWYLVIKGSKNRAFTHKKPCCITGLKNRG